MNKLKELISKKPGLVIIGTLLLGLLLGWWFFGGSGSEQQPATDTVTADHEHEEGTIWTCSMHPQIRETKPGKCPICGMDLIPLSNDNGDDAISPDAVVLTSAAMKIAEVETSVVEKRQPFKMLILPGMVKPDERRIVELTAHFPGRIEKLYVNFTGQKVRKGQLLATIFAPDVVTAQKELFESLKYKESNPQFYQAARNKFKLWLFTDEQIDEIERSGKVKFYFDIVSPRSGTVTKRNVALGDHVMEGMSMFQIIDLTHLWVEFDAYESDIPWIRVGSPVDITIRSVPGKVFKSKVTFIDPVLNLQTRTTLVRTELDNKSGILRPGMFAEGRMKSMLPGNREAVLVPKSAVLWTGKRAVVYVKEDHGDRVAFHYREIELGEDAGDYYVVVSGLEPGEEVVTNGAFKIDAAAQLKGAPSMMNPTGGKSANPHAGHSMPGMTQENEQPEASGKQQSSGEIDPRFKKQLAAVVDSYLALKEALVASDAAKAATAAGQVKQDLGKVQMELLKGDAHVMWMDMLKPLEGSLQKISGSKDIEAQRLAFADLTEALYQSLKMFQVQGLNIYYQFCPMARDGAGANWLSRDKDIRNPYFGEAMLTCGETKETLK